MESPDYFLENLARELKNIADTGNTVRTDRKPWESLVVYVQNICHDENIDEQTRGLLNAFNTDPSYNTAKSIIDKFYSDYISQFINCFSKALKWNLLCITDYDITTTETCTDNNQKFYNPSESLADIGGLISLEYKKGAGDSPLINISWLDNTRICVLALADINKSFFPILMKSADYVLLFLTGLVGNHNLYREILHKINFINSSFPVITNYRNFINPLDENNPRNIYAIENNLSKNNLSAKSKFHLDACDIVNIMVWHFKTHHLLLNNFIEAGPDQNLIDNLLDSLFPFAGSKKVNKAPHGFTAARNYWVEYDEKKIRFVKTNLEMNILEEYNRYRKFIDGSLENITGRIIDRPAFCQFHGAIKYSVAGSLYKAETQFPVITLEEGLLLLDKTAAACSALKWIINTIKHWWWRHNEQNKCTFDPLFCYGENLPPLIAGTWVEPIPANLHNQIEEIDCNNFHINKLEEYYKPENAKKILKLRSSTLLTIWETTAADGGKGVNTQFLAEKYGFKIQIFFPGKTLSDFKGKFRNRKIFDEIYMEIDQTSDNLWTCLKQWLNPQADPQDKVIKSYLKKIFGFSSLAGGISSWEVNIHGDLHFRNMLFEPANRGKQRTAWLIDFEKTRKACASVDLVVLEISLRAQILAPLISNQLTDFHAVKICEKRENCINNSDITDCFYELELKLWDYFIHPNKNSRVLPLTPKCIDNIIGHSIWDIFCFIRKTACGLGISPAEYACGLALYTINYQSWLQNPKDETEKAVFNIAGLCIKKCFEFHLKKFEELVKDQNSSWFPLEAIKPEFATDPNAAKLHRGESSAST